MLEIEISKVTGDERLYLSPDHPATILNLEDYNVWSWKKS